VAGAEGHESVVYRVGWDDASTQEALRQLVPAGAGTWTPPLERCLRPGDRYAWSVRALAEGAAPEWSKPAWFEVAREPSRRELEAAMRLVESYLASRGHEVDAQPGGASTGAAADSPLAGSTSGARNAAVSPSRELGSSLLLDRASQPGALTLAGQAAFRAEVPSSDSTTKFGVLGLVDGSGPQRVGVYGEVTDEAAPVSFGLLGVVSNFESWGIVGLNETTQEGHSEGYHAVGVAGQTGHSDGVAVVGQAFGDEGIGVVGRGDVGVKGTICSPSLSGVECFLDGTGVVGEGNGAAEYGGFFLNRTGPLIGAESDGDTENPTFLVDNDGNLTAQSISAASFDMSAFEVRRDSFLATGSNANSPSCAADELRVGGGCECLLNTALAAEVKLSRPEDPDFWRCECQIGNRAKAWVVCLGSPTM
jgi:hypothetical protein